MLWKKFGSMRKLSKKAKATNCSSGEPYEWLLTEKKGGGASPAAASPTGSFVVYVGEDRRRFVVPTGHLSHPLFKILLEKAYKEFGFEQRKGLVVPCSVHAFRQVIAAVECCNGRFDFGELMEEFI